MLIRLLASVQTRSAQWRDDINILYNPSNKCEVFLLLDGLLKNNDTDIQLNFVVVFVVN